MWETIKRYGGSVLLGLGATLLILGIIGGFAWLAYFLGKSTTTVTSLPLLAIGGVLVLIMMLTAVAIVFRILGLTDAHQAMGLPEGSIRAVIALSLIVLFAILAVFLYLGVSGIDGRMRTVENLSEPERIQFLKDHPNLLDVESVASKDKDGQPLVAKDAAGKPLTNTDGSLRYLYTLKYRTANAAADDFAKQLLVLLGTLMTAITSFYLGAGTATSAATPSGSGQRTAGPRPAPSGATPTSHSVATNGTPIHVQVTGTNLGNVTQVKLVRGTATLPGTITAKTATTVSADVPVTAAAATAGPAWDVVVDDGSGEVSYPRGITITA